MRLDRVTIKGFRNFDCADIQLNGSTLIIGANDVGKTNFLYALRLLFDKTISEHDLELNDNDYNAYTSADRIEITAFLEDVIEECLLSAFEGDVKEGSTMIRYINTKTNGYSFLIGSSEDTLQKYPSRKYIKYLNMQYVDSNRDLFSFLKHERNKILDLSKEARKPEEVKEDDSILNTIQSELTAINDNINKLHYVSKALNNVNSELGDLSVHNEDQNMQFIAGESNADKMLDNISLAYTTDDSPLTIGGDGRNNQIFLATWVIKQKIEQNVDHVTFYAIEEPEAHLHPHQQRKLSKYLVNHFSNQVLVTTHSSQIAAKFPPDKMVRLYCRRKLTVASSGGCSDRLSDVFKQFGYRRDSLSSEVFFSDGVFLVEGMSEVILFHALAEAIGLDLDKNNITILSVEGVGFKPYISVCNALDIPWVLRTDNDVFKKTKNGIEYHYYAGINRALEIAKEYSFSDEVLEQLVATYSNDTEWKEETPPEKSKEYNRKTKEKLIEHCIFLSNTDLENDLVNSKLSESLRLHYGLDCADKILVDKMQMRKAENMLDYVESHAEDLVALFDDPICTPLTVLIDSIQQRVHPENA